MQGAGIEVVRYHRPTWYGLSRLNNRTHRKVLIIDGATGFTEASESPISGSVTRRTGSLADMHFRAEGPVVAQMQAAFLDNWIKTRVACCTARGTSRHWPPGARRRCSCSSVRRRRQRQHAAHVFDRDNRRRTFDRHRGAYFIPDTLMIRELLGAPDRGVRIRVLLPGKYLDRKTVRIASKRGGPAARARSGDLRIPATMLHCKMLIFDEYMVSIGSTNFDMRSFELNDEASLNVYDAKLRGK